MPKSTNYKINVDLEFNLPGDKTQLQIQDALNKILNTKKFDVQTIINTSNVNLVKSPSKVRHDIRIKNILDKHLEKYNYWNVMQEDGVLNYQRLNQKMRASCTGSMCDDAYLSVGLTQRGYYDMVFSLYAFYSIPRDTYNLYGKEFKANTKNIGSFRHFNIFDFTVDENTKVVNGKITDKALSFFMANNVDISKVPTNICLGDYTDPQFVELLKVITIDTKSFFETIKVGEII